jgi:hypothetical protein
MMMGVPGSETDIHHSQQPSTSSPVCQAVHMQREVRHVGLKIGGECAYMVILRQMTP